MQSSSADWTSAWRTRPTRERSYTSVYDVKRRCLEPGCNRLTSRSRCGQHERLLAQRHNYDANHQKYRGNSWKALSRRARAEQPYCAVCGTDVDTTLDHATGLTVCRPHHLRDEIGGVARSMGGWVGICGVPTTS